jgi:hypothetical protein
MELNINAALLRCSWKYANILNSPNILVSVHVDLAKLANRLVAIVFDHLLCHMTRENGHKKLLLCTTKIMNSISRSDMKCIPAAWIPAAELG